MCVLSNRLARPAHPPDTISAHNSNNVTDLLPGRKIDVPYWAKIYRLSSLDALCSQLSNQIDSARRGYPLTAHQHHCVRR